MATRTKAHSVTVEAPAHEAGANGSASPPTLLTRAAILAADDVKREPVHVPEWGGTVLVQSMTGIDRDEFEAEMENQKGKDAQANRRNFRAKLAARTIVDEKGERLFSESDIAALGKKNSWALTRVAMVAARLSALNEQDIEELTTQLKEGPSATSGSD
jgi:hypothetical protein